MTSKKTYRVVCQELDLVLFVRGFSLDEEKKIYDSLRKKIFSEQTPIKIEDYKLFIIRKFMIEGDAFVEQLPEDVEDRTVAINAVYKAIVELYPPFSLEFICTDLNAQTFMSGEEHRFLAMLKRKTKNKLLGQNLGMSSIEDLENLRIHFNNNIVGQDEAISALINAMKLMASGLAKHSSFLFVGPTGVGKTQIAKILGEKFSGNFFKVNCAEYSHGHEYAKLIGSPPGFIGHSEKSLLSEKAEQSNRWVFLFDEIEKAHHKLYDFLLSLLDDGTCTDNLGNTLDFSQSIFIFTSNQGISEINKEPMGFDRKKAPEDKTTSEIIRKSVKRHFSPEFLNRIDDIIVFHALSKSDVKKIAKLQLEALPIKATDSLVEFVAEGGYSQEYGARNIARFIKTNVSSKIADAILNKVVPVKEKDLYTPRIVDGQVQIVDIKKFNASSN
jgi:ATP-dependent Clp protease ATP-binding subunit ClpA